jgi:phosphopantetheinyl transferase
MNKNTSTQTTLKEHSAFEKIKTYVYYAKIPKKYTLEKVYPLSRQKEIDSVTNIKVKEQKYFVWKLLSVSLNHLFGLDIKQFNMRKKPSGKWVSKDIYFSLSHSKNVVAVAISCEPVGVDLQAMVDLRGKLENKALTKKEKQEFNLLQEEQKQEYLITKWAQKESVFKMKNRLVFKPSKIQASSYSLLNHTFTVGDQNFVLCTSGKNLSGARICEKQI